MIALVILDYEIIRGGMPEGYHITEYSDLEHGRCDGRVLPTGCSGLAIVSRLPIFETQFYKYRDCGDWSKVEIDGECFATKGVGRVRLATFGHIWSDWPNITMDVFVTHTIAAPPYGRCDHIST